MPSNIVLCERLYKVSFYFVSLDHRNNTHDNEVYEL